MFKLFFETFVWQYYWLSALKLGGVVKCPKLKILNQILKMDDFILEGRIVILERMVVFPQEILLCHFPPPFSKEWLCSFLDESH